RARLDGVTVLHAVPRVLQAVVGERPGPRGGLRYLSTGGDVVPAAVLTAMAQVPGGTVEVNYGPTETTVICAAAVVDQPATGLLGRPLAATTIYVVSGSVGLVAAGGRGELSVGGVGVARGFAGEPARTATRCVGDQ